MSVQQVLNAFDELSEADQHRALVEMLRRGSSLADGDIPESTLVECAEELFLALDATEDAHGQG